MVTMTVADMVGMFILFEAILVGGAVAEGVGKWPSFLSEPAT